MTTLPRGRFVVLEGTDGAGTTTQGDLLAAHLRACGLQVVRTAQPSELDGGQLIRRILRGEIRDGDRSIDPAAVALLFAADRVDHGRRVVEPALQRGAWVVCDRHLGSSLAFQVSDGQAAGLAVDPAWVLAINRHALQADLSLWLDVPVAVAIERIAARGKPLERFETEAMLTRVRDRYAALCADPPAVLGRVVRIDASAAQPTVACAIRQSLDDVFGRPESR
ncbi:MAG: dTMP kinase [Deltaproteobacteria bacterium]|nr:dTMP kinase [Deltaproteobacteria bacterium]